MKPMEGLYCYKYRLWLTINRKTTNSISMAKHFLTFQSYQKGLNLSPETSEEVAKSQAKTLVDQLPIAKAHSIYHLIQSVNTESGCWGVELLHAPVWFAKYDHKGNKIVLVIDANSGRVINSLGL